MAVSLTVSHVKPNDVDSFYLDRDEMTDQILPTVSWSQTYYLPLPLLEHDVTIHHRMSKLINLKNAAI